MYTIAIEADMSIEAVGAPAEAKTDIVGAHFTPPFPVSVSPIEAEERYFENTSPELVIMAPHSNVYDDRPNSNDSFDGVIPTDATKEASAKNTGLGKGSQVGWKIYIRDTEPLPVSMIHPASSWISPKRMSVSNFTQGGTPKTLVLPLGPSKQQPLPLYRAFPAPFPHQDGASDKVPSPSESTHGRGNNDKETENLKSSTARRLFKGKVSHPRQIRRQWKGRFPFPLPLAGM